MNHHLDSQTQECLWRCPQCGASIRLANKVAVFLAQRAGGCQGCRAKAAFERDQTLIGLYLDFWARTDAWPQSDSWLTAIPAGGISILGGAHAGQSMLSMAGKASADQPAGRI